MAKKSTALATRDDDDYSLAVVVPDFLQGIESKGILADVEIQQNFLRLSLNGERFTIMDGRSEVEELGEEITVRFVHVHPHVQRAQYEEEYDSKREEWQPPRCYSNDGITPSANSAEPLAKKCIECPFAKKDTTPRKENTCSQFRNAVVQVQEDDSESEPMMLKIGAQSHWKEPSSGDGEELNFQRVLKWADRKGVILEVYPVELQFDADRDANTQLTFIPVGNRPLVASKAEYDELQTFIDDNKTVFDEMCTLDFGNVGDNSAGKEDTAEDEQEEREPPKRRRKKTAAKAAEAKSAPAEEPEGDDGGAGDASGEEDAVQAAPPPRARRTRRKAEPAAAPAHEEEGDGEEDSDDLPDDLKGLLGEVQTV